MRNPFPMSGVGCLLLPAASADNAVRAFKDRAATLRRVSVPMRAPRCLSLHVIRQASQSIRQDRSEKPHPSKSFRVPRVGDPNKARGREHAVHEIPASGALHEH